MSPLPRARRVLLALGGNAMTNADGRARPEDQIGAARVAMSAVSELLTSGDPVEVVVTHGNGPQVGNLLVKNELAAQVVPPVPLDWCGAQTQATLGNILMNALDTALAALGHRQPSAALVTRTRVDPADPGFAAPAKPIGRYLTYAEAQPLIEHGEQWQDRGDRGWRRVVASPEPLEIIDAPAIEALIAAGFVVIAAGGGGIPTVDGADGLAGIEAVIDKDLAAAVLARAVGADRLVIATDVSHAVLRYGTPQAEPIGQVSVARIREYVEQGHFASGSMGPKVDAVCRFVESSGCPGVITSLDHIVDGVAGSTGTVVVPD